MQVNHTAGLNVVPTDIRGVRPATMISSLQLITDRVVYRTAAATAEFTLRRISGRTAYHSAWRGLCGDD